jgi:nucleoside-diphosphate-sugar epimerase
VRLLVLGGTWFVGRAVAEAAVGRGHEVTCFNRGRSGTDVDGVETVRGDRTVADDVVRLAGAGAWDAVVDTGAYEPSDLGLSATVLREQVDRYLMVSTVSAYRDWPALPTNEESALWPGRVDARGTDPDIAEMDGAFAYGTLKASCELVIREQLGERTLILRPGVVLGPYEYVGRLQALLGRAAKGGRMLVAGDPRRAIQPVDVRDLAAFMLDLLERRAGGVFNAVAPSGHATYGELIEACVAATAASTATTWVEPAWLAKRDVKEWTELPLWRTAPGTWAVDGQRAATAGLVCRPLAETVTDTWAWLQTERPVDNPRAGEHGLDPEREARLLAEWDAELAARG